MRFTIHCTFASGAYANAKRLRLEHYAFLREVRNTTNTIIEGGPLLGADGVPSGMLMVVDVEDESAALAFIAKEPYNANGYFETVVVHRWSHVIPEPQPGYIEAEYQKELKLR